MRSVEVSAGAGIGVGVGVGGYLAGDAEFNGVRVRSRGWFRRCRRPWPSLQWVRNTYGVGAEVGQTMPPLARTTWPLTQ